MGWILSGMMLLVLAGIVILNLFRGKKTRGCPHGYFRLHFDRQCLCRHHCVAEGVCRDCRSNRNRYA